MRLLILILFSTLAMSSYAYDLKKIPDCDNMPGGCDNVFQLRYENNRNNYDHNSCTVRLLDRNNRLRETFRAPRCTTALNRCNAEIQRSNYYRAHCQIVNDRRSPREITRSCTYNAIERNRYGRTRVNASYTSRARGRNPERVKDRACNKAYRKCMNNRNYYERCVKAHQY